MSEHEECLEIRDHLIDKLFVSRGESQFWKDERDAYAEALDEARAERDAWVKIDATKNSILKGCVSSNRRLRAALVQAEGRQHRTWVAVSNYFAAKGKAIPADICLATTPEESS